MLAIHSAAIDLLSLPQEIILHIIDFAPPYDILSLRKTCKALYPITRDRSVWVHAVRKMCTERALFAPTYDLIQTSRLRLEHAATAPRRFFELLMNSGSLDLQDAQKLHAISKRLLELRLPRSSAANLGFNARENTFREFHLLPGGRFLLARSSESVHFWDLGTNATGMVEPFPIYHQRIKDLLGAKETPRTEEPDGPSMAIFPCVTKPNAMRFTYSLQDAIK
ncbi:hypothetical protein K525DRAFT_188364 [Schizophyllum commune Loenen D]|nr:hypothetical protein K525DRAFT_188364 [Schizophyllum commune Loenen D]